MNSDLGLQSKKFPTKQLSRLFSLLRPYRLKLFIILFALIATSATVLLLGHGLGALVDQGLVQRNASMLNATMLLLGGAIVLLAIATFVRSFLTNQICEALISNLRQQVMAKLVYMPPSFYETTSTHDIVARLTSDTTLINATLNNVISVLLRNSALLVGGIVMLVVTSLKLSFIVLLMVPIVLLPIFLMARKLRRLSRKSQELSAGLGGRVQEVLSGIVTVQAFTQENAELNRFSSLANQVLLQAASKAKFRAFMVASVIVVMFGAVLFVLWFGGKEVVHGRLSSGVLSSFIFYAILVAASFGAIAESISEWQRSSGTLDRIFALLDLTSHNVEDSQSDVHLHNAAGVEFSQVSFFYPSAPDRNVLQSVEFVAPAGKTTAIVGMSGAGKSSLFKLVLGFYRPQQGKIIIGGTELNKWPIHQLRKNIAIVPQDITIFSGTVAENIAYGKPDASLQEIELAAEQANAMEFISLLPKGLKSRTGEKGAMLSGGQRQRLAIARAILRDPKILLLDEATASLDSHNEELVQQALAKLMQGRTTLVIAHRLSTVKAADQIVVLDKGKVIACGNHQELVKSCELYRRLATQQGALT